MPVSTGGAVDPFSVPASAQFEAPAADGHEADGYEDVTDFPFPTDPELVREYRKTATVVAVQADVPFKVRTLEGTMRGEAGDYLCQGPAGERWPIKRERFEATYVPADAGAARRAAARGLVAFFSICFLGTLVVGLLDIVVYGGGGVEAGIGLGGFLALLVGVMLGGDMARAGVR